MVKYRTSAVFMEIEPIIIERETCKCVFLKSGRKEMKQTSWHNYFDTFQKAKDFVIEEKKNRVEALKYQLENAEKELNKALRLSPKEETPMK